MQGAPPLAFPRLSRKRHGLNLRGKYPEGEGGVPARQGRGAGDRAESHAGSGKRAPNGKLFVYELYTNLADS